MGRGENTEGLDSGLRRSLVERELSVYNPQSGEELPLIVYGEGDARAISQMESCLRVGSAVAGAMMGDHHVGYSQPIGGVVAYSDHLSPAGAGVDLGCGVTGFKTNIQADEIDAGEMMDEIVKRISFGVGRSADFEVDHPVLDQIKSAEWGPQRELYDKAAAQLGTVGSGNHYVNLLADESDGSLWISAHFGSRGFGAITASHFIKLAEELRDAESGENEEEFKSPGLLDASSEEGESYWAAMNLAGEYAKAGREIVCGQVLDVLGGELLYQANESHNLIWREEISGRELYVVRKGATPSNPGTHGVIGGSMEGPTVIVEGRDDAIEARARALNSTVHGAGRVMSRTAAKGKVKTRKSYKCESCGYEIPAGEYKQGSSKSKKPGSTCPAHGSSLRKRVWTEVIKEGAVDFAAVQERMARKGIELRGAGADESPEVYKDLDRVLEAHSSQIKILHRLRPIGVAMAGPETVDPYKD